jgi:hypothetical protein
LFTARASRHTAGLALPQTLGIRTKQTQSQSNTRASARTHVNAVAPDEQSL